MIAAEPKINVWTTLAAVWVLAIGAASIVAWAGFIASARRRQSHAMVAEGPSPKDWRGSTVVWVIAWYVALQFLTALGYGLSVYSVTTRREDLKQVTDSPQLQILFGTMLNLALVLTLPAIIKATSGLNLRALGLEFSRRAIREFRLGVRAFFLVAPPVFALFIAVTQLWPPKPHPVAESIQQQGAAGSAWLALISAVFAAPIAEELLFRGVLLGWLNTLARSATRPAPPTNAGAGGNEMVLGEPIALPSAGSPHAFWIPNVVVSLAFAGMHFAAWPSPIPLFVLSLALGWLVQSTGRLTAAIGLHAAFNAFSTILFLLVTQSQSVAG